MLLYQKVILVLFAVLASCVTVAQDTAKPDATIEMSESQQIASSLLLDMALQLGSAQRFRVDVRSGYDALQSTGQMIEFGEQRRVSVERPSLLLIEGQGSNGNTELIVFDGKWITVSDQDEKVYARAPQPGDIDATLKYFVGALGMRLPLAALLMESFSEELTRRMVDIAYVEETNIVGEPAHHLAGRTTDVDFQVWISAGQNSVQLRIVLSYREAPGQPKFWANFANWKFNPSFLLKEFQFVPLADEREVPLVAHFATEPASNSAPTTPGEQP